MEGESLKIEISESSDVFSDPDGWVGSVSVDPAITEGIVREIARLTDAVEAQTHALLALRDEQRDQLLAVSRDLYHQQRTTHALTESLGAARKELEDLRKLVYQTHSGGQHIYLTEMRGKPC